jgi:hypothetical protein
MINNFDNFLNIAKNLIDRKIIYKNKDSKLNTITTTTTTTII